MQYELTTVVYYRSGILQKELDAKRIHRDVAARLRITQQ